MKNYLISKTLEFLLKIVEFSFMIKKQPNPIICEAIYMLSLPRVMHDGSPSDSAEGFTQPFAKGSFIQAALSPREEEVLRDLYDGFSREEIAAGHELSVNAIKLMINSICEKLGARNIADMIQIAMEWGLV